MRITVICEFMLLLLASVSHLAAALPATVDRVQFKAGKVYVAPGDQVLVAPDQVTLQSNIVVQTNGSFKVKGGKERLLQEGEILGADGMLTKPDGSIVPVVDHVSLNRGRVILVKDGETSDVTAPLKLADGTVVSPDGKITPRTGSPRRLLDGELFRLEGDNLPSRDTVTMKAGRVTVQKDGSKLSVEPGRSITMNDGTKVFGDGTIVKFNGERSTLSEGQTVTLEGVLTRPR